MYEYIGNVNVQQEGFKFQLQSRRERIEMHDALSEAGREELKVRTVHRGRHLTLARRSADCFI